MKGLKSTNGHHTVGYMRYVSHFSLSFAVLNGIKYSKSVFEICIRTFVVFAVVCRACGNLGFSV